MYGVPTDHALRAWKDCPFVRMGLLLPEEAISLVDRFFMHMAPQSQILDGFFADHDSHHILVSHEKFLSCAILTVSSRHHHLGGTRGASRCQLIHFRLWEYCQRFITQLVFGESDYFGSGLRTLGTVEALLLLLEWHPLPLLTPMPLEDCTDSHTWEPLQTSDSSSAARTAPQVLAKEVADRAKKSDRFSLMILSCAITLANELCISGNVDSEPYSIKINPYQHELRLRKRRSPLCKVLYVYSEHLLMRTGSKQLVPRNAYLGSITTKESQEIIDESFDQFMDARSELARVSRMVFDTLPPSTTVDQVYLQSARCTEMVDHFLCVLDTWERRFLASFASGEAVKVDAQREDIMIAEHQTVKIITASAGLRALTRHNTSLWSQEDIATSDILAGQRQYARVIIDASLEILHLATRLAQHNALVYGSENLFMRIALASALIVVALGFEIEKAKLVASRSALEQVIEALKKDEPDDLHLASYYAALLEQCLSSIPPITEKSSMPLQGVVLGDAGHWSAPTCNSNLMEKHTDPERRPFAYGAIGPQDALGTQENPTSGGFSIPMSPYLMKLVDGTA
ncbi:unnamed protein product [Clonostachys rhizophaga]|uniref:Transcription factor domain-containing protein n=1 Tax=Clonostachys rhizophaga TaxID=160324 RepID=A0A9N9YQS0_9HYPO|nr:unnamed protein product [Clonostachys rhizophaga]